MSNMKNLTTGLPGWAKGTVAVSVVAGVAVISYLIYRKVKAEKALKGAKNEVDAVAATTKVLTGAGQKPSLDDLKLSSLANQLFTAMDGYGSDAQSIYRAFANVKNDLDVVNLIKAYGIRNLSSGALNPTPNITGTLSQHITDELSASEVKALNDLLARKGIKYRF